eukprot:1690356-Amphidinium_carterae.1
MDSLRLASVLQCPLAFECVRIKSWGRKGKRSAGALAIMSPSWDYALRPAGLWWSFPPLC